MVLMSSPQWVSISGDFGKNPLVLSKSGRYVAELDTWPENVSHGRELCCVENIPSDPDIRTVIRRSDNQ